MKKNLICTVLVSAMIGLVPCMAQASDDVKVVIDGRPIQFDVPAQIINGRTMVPVRKVFEELGMSIQWDEESQSVLAGKTGVIIELPIGSLTVYHNTVSQTTDTPAQIVDGRTLVPIRLISEFSGAIVSWDDAARTVYITSRDNIKYLDWNEHYDYYGEVSDGKANGYGTLCSKENNDVIQMGYYIDSTITSGSSFFDDGSYFTGLYSDGELSAGIFTFPDNSYYKGEFKNNRRHGKGVYESVDGVVLDGVWENDQYIGVANNENYNTIIYGNTVTDSDIEAYYNKLYDLNAKYDELYTWYEQEAQKLYDYALYGDPFSTDWAKEIMDKYDYEGTKAAYNAAAKGAGNNGGNIDSFSAANAQRQKEALKAQGRQEVLEYNEKYIANMKKAIEDSFESKKKLLDMQKERLEAERKRLGL